MREIVNCCCRYGAAVAGEWPEFQCYDCPIHLEPFMAEPYDKCRRHRREERNRSD